MPKSIGPKLFLGQSCFVTKCFQAKVCMGLKYSLVQSIFWSKVFSGPKYFLVQSILRSKGFSAPKYSLDRSIPWAEVCLRPKYVWGQSECGMKAVLGPNWGHLLFTQTKLKIHVPCDISAHANSWVCLHCDDVVSICKWNLLLLFF